MFLNCGDRLHISNINSTTDKQRQVASSRIYTARYAGANYVVLLYGYWQNLVQQVCRLGTLALYL
ncbi:hypothetical protein [Gloeocapsopsis sp. IPPAS B-1203]|uniref:hypothetical protein n=1 Tax=Gloeocapsopsis sp. IPPAS B-1203 TaxID=2049454 RepID=UPI000C188BA6|nr:hypothetical protein [Gloeocapsopsis sp. IPPAS B-1203]PIG94426.1 hypothetical protein CSQ79_03810 [Gloeocapsopsis sp. IPPAS B-1203]